jgi:flagellar assembly protein FliH
MPIVKANLAQSNHQSAIVMDLSDLEKQAGKIITEAKAAALKILADARAAATAEAAAIKEAARKAGHDEGFAAGESKGHQAGHDEAVKKVSQTLQELTVRWTQTLDILEQNLPTHVADAKTDLIKLSLAIAGRVTRNEALRNRQVAEATVSEALSLVGAGRTVALHVHPDEFDAIESYLPALVAKLRTISAVELKRDETVGVGGCEVRFGAGQIDARIETQMDRIAAELLTGGAVESPQTPPAAEGRGPA